MGKFKKFALKRPFLFGIVLIFIYALLGTLTYPAHFLFPETEVGQLNGDALSKFIIFMVFFFFLWRFGWIKASRITRLGNPYFWLVVAVILIYQIFAVLYAFTGNISIAFPKSQLAIANLVVNLPTSLVEETMFRALALVAMITAWGNTKQGQIKAVFLSSLFFGLIHLFNLIVRPFGVVLLQATAVILQGMIFATLVLSFRSLWPAIIIHWLTNAAVNIKLSGYESYQETFTMWFIFALTLIPIIVYGAYLIWKLPDSYQYETVEAG
jgi:membrane protease YdiL (CAAX protease family)